MNTDNVDRLRANAVKNLAQSMGIPPELLAGPPTPWHELLEEEAEEIAEGARKAYNEMMAHVHVTFLWPWLRALGVPDAERYHVVHEDGYLAPRAYARETLPAFNIARQQAARTLEALHSGPPPHRYPEHVTAVDTLHERLVQRGVAQKHQATLLRVSLDDGVCESVLIAPEYPREGARYVLVNLVGFDKPVPNAAGQQCVVVSTGWWEVMHVRPERVAEGIAGRAALYDDSDTVTRNEALTGLNEGSEIETVADRIELVLNTIRW